MAESYDKKSRILYVLKLLWEESDELHPVSAASLSKKLETYGIKCERRSIFHCFDMLEEFGFDIIRTNKGTYLGNRFLELPELKLLVDAVQSSKFITSKKSSELIDRLSGLSSIYDKKLLKNQVYVSGRVKTMNESIYYNIDAVSEAIADNLQITFQYLDWSPDKKMIPRHDGKLYEISPWCLVWERERYYMIGYDAAFAMMKHYRVDKMRRIVTIDKKREGKSVYKSMDMSAYTIENFGMYAGRRQTVNLTADKNMAGVIIDRFGTGVWMHEAENGELSVSVEVSVSPQFFGWITAMGGKVRIAGPNDVKAEYYELLGKCMER